MNNTPNNELIQTLSKMGSRKSFGFAMEQILKKREDVIVMTADLFCACVSGDFLNAYRDRCINAGIAEQNMVGMAVGIASCGKTVIATTFAAFATMRAYEQVRTDAAYMKANVKLVGMGAGVVFGVQGYTHFAIEDIAIMRAIPNMVVVSPSDGLQTLKALKAVCEYKGPVYLRLTGGGVLPPVYKEDFDFEIGKAIQLREGKDMTIIAAGSLVNNALMAADLLNEKGISASVVDMHTIKPLDEKAVISAAEKTPQIFTVEEHTRIGGLGAAVCEVLAEKELSVKVVRLGLPDKFGDIADYDAMLNRFKLDAGGIAEQIRVHYQK